MEELNLYRVSLLRRGIRLAERVELQAQGDNLKKPIQRVSFGFVILNRRLAVAITQLGINCAYEERILLRSMIEIMINYAWIRHRKRHSRATRFLAYLPLELLQINKWTRTAMSLSDYKTKNKSLMRQRAQVRHLFRRRSKKGKLFWAKHWATTPTVLERLYEIQDTNKSNEADPFLYAIYSWFCSPVHGGPVSMHEIFDPRSEKLMPAKQPEEKPTDHFLGGAVVLAFTLGAAVEDLELSRSVKDEMERYSAAVFNRRKLRERAANQEAKL